MKGYTKKIVASILAAALVFTAAPQISDAAQSNTNQGAAEVINGTVEGMIEGSEKLYYIYTADADGYVSFDLNYVNLENNSAKWSLYIYNSANSKLTSYSGQTISTDNFLMNTGNVLYLQVGGSLNAKNSTFSITSNFTPLNTEKEPNDVYTNATELVEGTEIYGMISGSTGANDSKDYYMFTPSGDGKVVFNFVRDDMTHGSTSTCWYIKAYNDGNKAVSGASGKATTSFSLPEVTVNSGKPVYFEIYSGSNNKFIAYKVSVTFTAGSATSTATPTPTPTPSKTPTKTPTTTPTVTPSTSVTPTAATETTEGSTDTDNVAKQIKTVTVSVSSVTNITNNNVTINVNQVSGASGYQIKYATNKKLKKAKIIKSKSATAKLKKLKKGKTYFYKVRAYKKGTDGKTYYSKWSKAKKFKTKK